MSRVRSAAKVAVSENTACYENLANAIILQAVKDYKWYEALTDLDADRLIEGVKERVHQEAAKRRKKKAAGKAPS